MARSRLRTVLVLQGKKNCPRRAIRSSSLELSTLTIYRAYLMIRLFWTGNFSHSRGPTTDMAGYFMVQGRATDSAALIVSHLAV